MFSINHKYKSNIFIVLSFLAVSILCFSILIYSHTFYGTIDNAFHLKRILELKDSLSHGVILPNFSFNEFHGSAIMTLYPYLNLFPVAILSLFVSSKLILYYIWIIFNEFLSLIISFYCAYTFNKSKRTSYIFSLLYGTSIFFLRLGQGLTDSGILTACAVLPLVIFGCINLTQYGKYIELSIGMTLLIYCHILTSLIAFIFVVMWLIANISKLDIHKYIDVFKSFLLTLLLTSFFWVPFCYYIFITKIDVATPASAKSVKFLVGNSGGIVQIARDLTNRLSSTSTFLALLGLVLTIVFYKYLSKVLRKMFWISIILLILCCDIFPWKYVPHFVFEFFGLFQNISRFYIIPQLLLSYLFSYIVCSWLKNHNRSTVNLGIFGIILIVALLQIDSQINVIHQWSGSPLITENYSNKHFSKDKFNHLRSYKLSKSSSFKYLLSANYYPYHDYYPKVTINKFINVNNNEATYGHDRTINVKRMGYNRFSFNSPKRINRLTLPLLHYNGEHLRVYVNHHLVHSHANGNSLVTLDNVKKGRSVVGVRSVPNVWLIILECIILLALIIWAYLNFLKYKNFKHFYNKILDKKYFCIMSSLLITIIIMPLFVLFRMPITNINISIIDICIMGIPYCIMLDIILHFLRFDFVATILSKHIKNDKILRYFNIFIKNFNLKFKRLARIKSNILLFTLIFICSLIFEVFVISMTRMSHIIVELNRINKYIGRQYLSKINDSYSLYFMSWIILGIALLFILSIFYYKKIDYHFMKLYPLVIVSIVSIIGVMLTTLSTVQRGAYTQSISYNFSIMFIYLMTPVCIIFIDLIHIFKMIQNHELFLYHKNVNSLLNPKDIVKDEMYNSQYHYTNK